MENKKQTATTQGVKTDRSIGPMVILNQLGRLVKNLNHSEQKVLTKQDIETIRAIHTKAIQAYLNVPLS